MPTLSVKKYWDLQLQYVGPYKLKILALAISLLIFTSLDLLLPQVIRYYIDVVQTSQIINRLIFAGLLYLIFSIIKSFIDMLQSYLIQDLSWTSTNDLRSDLIKHCIGLDMSFHNQYKPGEMIERIDGDVGTLSNFFSQFVLRILSVLLILIGTVTVVFVENTLLGIVFLVYTIISIILMYLLRDISVKNWKEARGKSMILYGQIEESIAAIEDTKANGFVEYIYKKFYDASKSEYETSKSAILKSLTYTITWRLLRGISTFIVFLISVPLYNAGIISIGTIFLIHIYTGMILNPISVALRQIQDFQAANASIQRIEELFETESVIKTAKKPEEMPKEINSLTFENLSFSYTPEEEVLKNISFNLTRGNVLGLIGRTGSGKTTLSRLLFRLYEIDEGSIKINEEDIRNYKLNELRSSIAYVTQDVELFEGNLRENITFFNKNIPDEDLFRVIESIGLQEWFEQLPNGLDTKIVSEETGLSAGEAQLLALTRAFLKEPKIVVLDEASSRIDPATEKLLSKTVEKLLENKIGIIIAHRLDTLKKVDHILILERGSVIEYGSRKALQKDETSKYSELMRTKSILEVLK